MDNAMVKRGIGAIVLAIIAALLLGWLLKDKSSQRQEVVEMDIPSLTDPIQTEANTGTAPLLEEGKSLLDTATDKAKETGAAVIASASGAADTITETAGSTLNTAKASISDAAGNISTMKPGFAIRPSSNNEEKEITDSTGSTAPIIEENGTGKQATGQVNNAKETVVASASNTVKKAKKVFKPQIVEKKKKATPKPKQVVTKKKEAPKAATPNISTAPIGKYSVQLLATSSQSRANKLAKTMTGEGYQVFVTQTTRDAKILYRVRIGGHGDRNKAIKAQEGMKKRYRKNFFVQNSLVVSN